MVGDLCIQAENPATMATTKVLSSCQKPYFAYRQMCFIGKPRHPRLVSETGLQPGHTLTGRLAAVSTSCLNREVKSEVPRPSAGLAGAADASTG